VYKVSFSTLAAIAWMGSTKHARAAVLKYQTFADVANHPSTLTTGTLANNTRVLQVEASIIFPSAIEQAWPVWYKHGPRG
jgi:hypothetical protein